MTQIQVEWRADVFEALVIGENLTLIAQQILTSCYHSMNHHFKLEMKSWIAKLMFAQRSGKGLEVTGRTSTGVEVSFLLRRSKLS